MSDTNSESDTSSICGDPEDLSSRVHSNLSGTDEPVTLGELAARVDDGDGEVDSSRGDVHEILHDRVLPDLDADGAIEFDVSTGLVEPIYQQEERGTLLRRGASRLSGLWALVVPVVLGGATAIYTGRPLPTLGVSVASLGVVYLLGLLAS